MKPDVIGTKELIQRMRGISEVGKRKTLEKAIRLSMAPMRRQAKQNAPQGEAPHRTYKNRLVAPGFLRRNVKLKKMKFNDPYRAGYTLKAWGEAWYGSLIETGWRPGKRENAVKRASRSARGGLSRGSLKGLRDFRKEVPGRPWLGPAYKSTKSTVLTNFKKKMASEIAKTKRLRGLK